MSPGALRGRALLSGTMLVAVAVGYGRRAYAACVNVGGSTYQCSGTNITEQTISANNAAVSTLPGFSVNTAPDNGITITGDGALSYTDTNASPLTSAATALYVKSTGNDAGTSTPGSITIATNGAITGTNSAGIVAFNLHGGTDISVTTGAGTTVSGGITGIYARNRGTGAITITANGDVTGTSHYGISAWSYGSTSLSVTTGEGTTVSGGITGIQTRSLGSGALTVTANGDVTGSSGAGIYAYNRGTGTDLSVTTGVGTTVRGVTDGIYARNRGTGALTVTANGDVSGTVGDGIYATNSATGTDLSVTTGVGAAVSGKDTGIDALNYGTGALTVTANGDVTGTTGDGIVAYNSAAGTNLGVTTGVGTAVSGTTGIDARNEGSGALTVTANGDVTGTDAFGIVAVNSAAGTDLSVTTGAGTAVSAARGIEALNLGSGALTIVTNGDVTGSTAGAIYARSGATPISITVAATSTVTSAAAFAIETVGGPATVTVAGTVAGSMKIGGTLTFQPGATFKVFVTPATASLASVTVNGAGPGTATLGGTVNAAFAAGSYVTKQYTILTAAGGLGGTTFSTLTTAGLPVGFLATLSYDADDVFLNLALAFISTDGLTENQSNVANAINTFFANGGALPPGFVSLAGLTGDALSNGLDQASGEPGADVTQTSFDAMNLFMNLLFGGNGGGAGGSGGSALGYASNAHPAVSDEARQAYAAVTPKDRMPVKAAPAPFAARWSAWASGYGGSSTVSGDSTAGSHDTTSHIYGMAAGADYRVSPDTLLGFALGGAGFNFNLSGGLGSGRADLFQAGLYGRHRFGNAYVAGALAYGWQDVTTDRTVTISGTDKLEADFHPQTFAARLEGGYRFATPWLGVTPYGALQATSFHQPSYAERATSGSNQFALTYNSQTTTNLRTELGARFDKSLRVTGGLLTLRSRLAWAHDSNTDRPASATFQTLPGASFTVNGAAPAADGALVSAGAEMRWANGFSLAGSFEGEFSGTTQSYAGKGTLRYVW